MPVPSTKVYSIPTISVNVMFLSILISQKFPYFTALLGMDKNTFNVVYLGIKDDMIESKVVRKKDKIAAVFMVLKLGNSFEAIGALYDVNATTISRWFGEIIELTNKLSVGAINWWTREQVQARMPEECRYWHLAFWTSI